MHLGIDFGTTRTIVAAVDRGNYPVVSFTDHTGETVDHVPTVAARQGDHAVFGFQALAAAERGATLLRSFKRLLASGSVSQNTTVDLDGLVVPLSDLVAGFLAEVRHSLLTSSNIADALVDDSPLRAVVAVPAHAHSAQRFLTLEAFDRAGFEVLALLNEPSAAGFEYTHRQSRTVNRRRTRVLVYDLGGGTFDASLVKVDDLDHEVLGSLGVNRLGGDDFDRVLADCAIRGAGTQVELSARELADLLDECRSAKEGLSPQSRRVVLEVGSTPVVVDVEDFYAHARPLVEATLEALAPLVGGLDASRLEESEVAGLYLVGGASGLPLVSRVLRERFGRRVHRSPHPAASTAIGLAVSADATAGYHLTERLSRGFGVFRESDDGAGLAFDPVLSADRRLDAGEEVVVRRRYRPRHNVGVFRFVEHSRVGGHGEPTGDVVPVGELRFPFDPALRDGRDLAGVPVARTAEGPLIDETYTIDASGIIEATVTDVEAGWSLSSRLGRTPAVAGV